MLKAIRPPPLPLRGGKEVAVVVGCGVTVGSKGVALAKTGVALENTGVILGGIDVGVIGVPAQPTLKARVISATTETKVMCRIIDTPLVTI